MLKHQCLENNILLVSLESPFQALNVKAVQELDQLLFSGKPPAGLIFTGAGRFFCTGGDLKHYASFQNKAEGIEVNTQIAKVLTKVTDAGFPTVALVNGDCYGGGVEFLSTFGYIISSPQCVFGMWQRKQGLSFGWGGYGRLNKRLPEQYIKNWLNVAEVKTAYELQEVGFIDQLVIPAKQRELAMAYLNKLLSVASKGNYLKIKKDLNQDERALFNEMWWSKEHQDSFSK